jgi:hypothetical protein
VPLVFSIEQVSKSENHENKIKAIFSLNGFLKEIIDQSSVYGHFLLLKNKRIIIQQRTLESIEKKDLSRHHTYYCRGEKQLKKYKMMDKEILNTV